MDFDDVMLGFASLGRTGNVGVIVAVCVFFMLYIVGVVFARRADRRDKQQVTDINTIKLLSNRSSVQRSPSINQSISKSQEF